MRILCKFLNQVKKLDFKEGILQKQIAEFLDIENPNTYRNTLSALKHYFKFLEMEEMVEIFKFKAVMPSFSIKTPSLEEIRTFCKAIENDRVKIYYLLGVTSAIRPQHLLRLTKKLFDTNNNMINTWMKTFGKKNFFFSFYTDEVKPIIEQHLTSLPTPDSKLFPVGYRYIQKQFVKTQQKTNIRITPKTMRKFTTNYLIRNGMLPQDVDVLTSHTPKSIVAKHYLDTSRIKQEYFKATQNLKLL